MNAFTPPFASDWAFFLDVDGTLLEIAEHPEEITVPPLLRGTLQQLQAATEGALALVSGRPIAALDRFFAPLRIAAAGEHGFERRDTMDVTHRFAAHDHKLQPVRRRLREFVDGHPGTLLEEKTYSVALHYRRAPGVESEARGLMRALLPVLSPEYELQEGKMVYEFKPAGRTKGTAVQEFMTEAPFRGKTPVFIGDDVTDEHGFSVVINLGGIAIKVGGGETCAPWRLPDARVVLGWLQEYIRFCNAQQAPRTQT